MASCARSSCRHKKAARREFRPHPQSFPLLASTQHTQASSKGYERQPKVQLGTSLDGSQTGEAHLVARSTMSSYFLPSLDRPNENKQPDTYLVDR